MTRTDQLKLAWTQDESHRKRVVQQRAFVDDLDEQIAAAMKRWELTLQGLDAHKVMAEQVTDDPEHPVAIGTIYDQLARRNGRRPPAEVIAVLYEADQEFATWWNTKLGYAAPAKLVRLSPEQENALLRRALQEFGAAGEQKLRAIASTKPEPGL